MIKYDQQTEGIYMKNNNFLFAAVLPVAYAAYKYYTDKSFKDNVNSNVDKLCTAVDAQSHKLKKYIERTADDVKIFFGDTYRELKLSDEQIEDIQEILANKRSGVSNRVKKLLNDEQKKIYDASLKLKNEVA